VIVNRGVAMGRAPFSCGLAKACAFFSCVVAVDSAGAEGYLGPTQSAPEGLAHEDAE